MARPDDLADELRRLALSLPETYEDEPWGHPVFKVADNKMFASMSVAADCVQLTVKLTAEEREIAQLLPYVSEARWVGRYGWITAQVTDLTNVMRTDEVTSALPVDAALANAPDRAGNYFRVKAVFEGEE